MKATKKLTFSAIMCALGMVFLLFGALIDVLDLSAVALASLTVLCVLDELGTRYAFGAASATVLLAFLILPTKTIAVEYLLVGGLYPILKKYFDCLPRLLSFLCKFLYASAVGAAIYLLFRFVFLIEVETGWMLIATAALLYVTFFLYDFCLARIIRLYRGYLRTRLRIDRYFRK